MGKWDGLQLDSGASGERAMGAIGRRGPHEQHLLRSSKRKINSQLPDGRPEQLLKESGEWWDRKGWRDDGKGGEERTTEMPHDLSLKLGKVALHRPVVMRVDSMRPPRQL